MYTVAGVTGRVGSAVADRLLAEGAEVRVLVRDRARAERFTAAGAEVAVVDLRDREGLTAALADSRGLFALLPFDLSAADFDVDTDALTGSITGAVAASGVPHVVALSSWGADLPAGTGPIVGLHRFEERLRTSGAVVTTLRSGHFQEKVSDVLDAARHGGVYPVFASSADVPKTMIATRDVGIVAAEALLDPPSDHEVIELHGPTYTERQVAERLAALLDRPLEVLTIPEAAWAGSLVEAGLPPHMAEVLSGLYAADEQGLLAPRGDRAVRCTTPITETLAPLVAAHG